MGVMSLSSRYSFRTKTRFYVGQVFGSDDVYERARLRKNDGEWEMQSS
jgi:hypothetical protein